MPSGPPACQLQASAPRTGVTASSGSPTAWPTPAVRDGKGGYLGGRIRDGELSTDTLDVAAQLSAWPTPVAQDDNKSPEAHLAMKERMGGNRTAVTSLQVMAKMTAWPTPVVEDARSSARHGYMKEGHAGTTMLDAARLTHWPTPKAMEVDESPETYHARGLRNPNLGPRSSPASLGTCVKLTSWPTPTAANADGGQQPKNVSSTGKREDGSKATVSLGMIAKLTTWPTPRAEDGESSGMRWSRGKADTLTAVAVQLTGWPTPHANSTTGAGTQGREGGENLQTAALGTISSGSPAATANTGQLNPAFSRWLMGYPAEWDACVPTATPSYRKSRLNSSKPILT